jgi:hypothetical protein
MTTQEKKAAIAIIIAQETKRIAERINEKAVKVLNSGCIDIDGWDFNSSPMLIPKSIIAAILQQEAEANYMGKGTSKEKIIKKEIRNIRYFI